MRGDSPNENNPSTRHNHWDGVYRTKGDQEVSWHQDEPTTSLDLIREVARPGASVIDIGGGSSVLAGRLLESGFHELAVLDISETALERARVRIAKGQDRVRWIIADVTATQDVGQFDVWHDRAVFHFLTDPEERSRYVSLVMRTIPVGGRIVIGTFALDGPEKCSGLPVRRYDSCSLAAEFGTPFVLNKILSEQHITPWGKPQSFLYVVLSRVV